MAPAPVTIAFIASKGGVGKTTVASATAAGAGAMLERTPDPAALRAGVSSPAGTTVAAIRELEESGLRGAFYRATEICAERSDELGK